MLSVPREKYPEMNWRAADKVAAWKVFKWRMEVIFVADQIPEERQWALILVAGGDEAYNRWDTLEDTVQDRKKVEQVWKAFEKSFEQSTSFWHFRDTYLADFRQDESETTADLDLCIKQTVRGCQWQKESEEERMIDLLYHATIYYEIRKFVQESDPNALTYEMVIEKAKAHERNVLEYKDHQASHGGANSAPSYNNPLLSAHALSKRRPSGRGNNGQHCGKCGKSHERGNCPAYGKTENVLTSFTSITGPPPMAFTDPSDFDEVLKEGDEYLSKIEEELGNEGRKQILSRIEKGFAKTVKWETINFPLEQFMKYHLRLPFPHAPKVLSRNPKMWVNKTPILEHPAVLIAIPEWESRYGTKSYAVDVNEGYIYAVRSEDWERLVERAYVAMDEPLELSQKTPVERKASAGKVQTLDSKERVPLAESTRKDFKEPIQKFD